MVYVIIADAECMTWGDLYRDGRLRVFATEAEAQKVLEVVKEADPNAYILCGTKLAA